MGVSLENIIKILLVDDHRVVREGLRHMLELEVDIEVVGEAADAKEALNQVKLLSPDIILLDIKMPGMDGVELTRHLKEKQPSCNVIMLTLYEEYLAQAMEAGASGYLLKDIERAELAQAIRQVQRGGAVISESITSKPRIEYEERNGKKAEGGVLQGYGGFSTMLEEVQVVLSSLVEANQLVRFISRVEEVLESRVLQMIGSWKGGTAVTVLLSEPASLESILIKLGEMPEIGTVGEKPLTGEGDPSLLKKADAMPRAKNRRRKTVFVTLKDASPGGD